jgi:hypothetical protein
MRHNFFSNSLLKKKLHYNEIITKGMSVREIERFLFSCGCTLYNVDYKKWIIQRGIL